MSSLNQEISTNYYEILNVSKQATPQQICQS